MDTKQGTPKEQSQIKSFAVAFIGLKVIFMNERNFRIHLVIGLLALLACFIFGVTANEWIAVLILIAIILCAEALNTSIEYLCDYITPEFQPMIKNIKDVAAGAVLLCAIVAVIIGCIIFIPYIKALLV